MPSYDLKFSIERYPQEGGGASWGCPDLNLMGYILFEDLCKDIHLELNKMMGKSKVGCGKSIPTGLIGWDCTRPCGSDPKQLCRECEATHKPSSKSEVDNGS